MKRIVSVLLVLVLTLGLAACGSADSEGSKDTGKTPAPAAQFMAGFGRVDVTPKEPVPLDSYGNPEQRMSDGFLSYMYANALAVTDENGESLIFVVGDMSWCPANLEGDIRKGITQATGVPADHIVLSGTHTHAGVATYADVPSAPRYGQTYIAAMIKAAELAMEDRKPAQIFTGSVTTESMNFVRRYIMDDGSLTADNTAGTGTSIVSHETQADPELQLLKFTREGGKDIVVGQFQAHPHLEGKTSGACSQTPGAFREAMEKSADCHAMYWNGAAGNVNSHSRITGETLITSRTEYGKKMAQYAMSIYDSMTPVEAGPVKVASVDTMAKVNHKYDSQIIRAQEVADYFAQTNDAGGAQRMGLPYGINSAYHAQRILANAQLPESQKIYQFACSFGDVSFIVLPYEMFDTNGMYIKENTPFERTFIIGYSAPAYGGYIPSAQAWENGGYECDNSTYAPGTAEELAEGYLDLLKQLKEN